MLVLNNDHGIEMKGTKHEIVPFARSSSTRTRSASNDTSSYGNKSTSVSRSSTSSSITPLSTPLTTSDLAVIPVVDGRLVRKNGVYNIDCFTDRTCDKCRLMSDLFTTLVELKWRYIAILFIGVFTVSWLTFGMAWWGVVVAHEDHLHENDTTWKPCLSNVYSLPDALLFSIDLQSTMGYGFGEIETACPGAIGFFMLQSVFGIFIECVATGIVFSKLIRPKRRFRTIMFSDRAVVFREVDGRLALQFRVGDMRRRCLIAASISAILIKTQCTSEGEQVPLCQHNLELRTESEDETTFLLWPETITHVLDETSPLYGLTADSLMRDADGRAWEIVVLLEGTDDTTGMATQLRTSFLPSEILFGHRMMPLPIRPLPSGQCRVDYSVFNSVYKDEDCQSSVPRIQLCLAD